MQCRVVGSLGGLTSARFPPRCSEKEDAGTDGQRTIEANEHAVIAVVNINVVEIGIE